MQKWIALYQIYSRFKLMRLKTWVITYLCETVCQMMRISFSFVQFNIALFYSINSTDLGIFLALSNILMAVCYFYRILFPFRNLVNGYFLQISLSAICLLIFPISMLLNIHSVAVGMIAYSLFGLFQGSGYSLLAGLVSQRFLADEDGFWLGTWGSAGDAGNLLGLFLFTSIMYYLKWDWKLCIIIPALLSLLMNSLLKKFLIDQLAETEEQRQESNWREEVVKVKEFFHDVDKAFIFFTSISLAALEFGILLWLPMYLKEIGFHAFQGYITIAYTVFSLIGSSLTGKIYENIENRRVHFLIQIWMTIFGLIPLLIIYLSKFQEQEKWVLVGLIGLAGFCNGALRNMYTTNQVFLKTEREGADKTPLYMNIIIGGEFALTGITQIFLGIFNTSSHKSIFLLFAALFIWSLILILARLLYKTFFKDEDD